jgi:hypothetical protein
MISILISHRWVLLDLELTLDDRLGHEVDLYQINYKKHKEWKEE